MLIMCYCTLLYHHCRVVQQGPAFWASIASMKRCHEKRARLGIEDGFRSSGAVGASNNRSKGPRGRGWKSANSFHGTRVAHLQGMKGIFWRLRNEVGSMWPLRDRGGRGGRGDWWNGHTASPGVNLESMWSSMTHTIATAIAVSEGRSTTVRNCWSHWKGDTARSKAQTPAPHNDAPITALALLPNQGRHR